MKILVACEESQRVTIELRSLGHEAYSCDIEPESGGHPEWHIQDNVLPILNGCCVVTTADGVEHTINDRWDMILAFPPCTKTTNAGARHLWAGGVEYSEILRRAMRQGSIHGNTRSRLRENRHREPNPVGGI